MNRAQPICGPARTGLLRFVLSGFLLDRHHVGVGVVIGGFRRPCSASAAAPPPAPSWFGLLAVRHPSDSSCHEHSLPPTERCTLPGRLAPAALTGRDTPVAD